MKQQTTQSKKEANKLLGPSFFNLANSITLLRLPLAALIWLSPRRPKYVLGVMLVAGFTDVLDGWLARRMSIKSSWGKWLDPLCDKVFVLSTLGAVTYANHLSGRLALLIAMRELVQASLTVLYFARIVRPTFPVNFEAVLWGKLTTCLQFAAMSTIVLKHRPAGFLVSSSVMSGLLASGFYVYRVFSPQKMRTVA